MKPEKYLTKADKTFKRVNKEYAFIQAEKHKELTWLNEHRQNVINTCPARIARNFESFDFKNIIKQEVQSLFIHGKAGVGKSVLSAYYYINFIHDLYVKRGVFSSIDYHYVIFPNFIEEMQKDFKDTEKLMQKYSMCDVLVLDDFGIKKATDYVYSLTYLLINDRYLNMLPTIINSNYSLAELSTIFEDDRIIRRIEEDYILIDKQTWKKL